MYILCDSNDVIQDTSTRKENLSRGQGIPGKKEYEISDDIDIRIFDTWKDGSLIPNQAERDRVTTRAEQEKKISDQIRSAAVESLKSAGQLPANFEA